MALVPFSRELDPVDTGIDVRAVQRALRKAGFRRIPPTGMYGNTMRRNVRRFQRAKGLPVTGVYDIKTHRKLGPYFDAYGTKLMARARHNHLILAAEERIQARAVEAMTVMYNRRADVHYSQRYDLRMEGVNRGLEPDEVEWGDCSGMATYIYKWAGAPDPNGFGYNGTGYTGTLIAHGVDVGQVFLGLQSRYEPMDLLFYGRPAVAGDNSTFVSTVKGARFYISHVAIAWTPTRVWSHGSESGPHNYAPDYSGRLQFSIRYPLIKR